MPSASTPRAASIATFPKQDKAMLAMRMGERQCVLTEEIRVHGPAREAAGDTMPPGPYIQLGSFNCPRQVRGSAAGLVFRFPAAGGAERA